jgi:chromosomal replication initiation ATPase DnaA
MKYEIRLYESYIVNGEAWYEVEADSESEAVDKIKEKYKNYEDHTLEDIKFANSKTSLESKFNIEKIISIEEIEIEGI